VRQLWEDHVQLDKLSPTSKWQNRSLWFQWVVLLEVLLLALAGPNFSTMPEMVAAGAVQVQFLYDVSPSMGAEDYRSFLPAPPGGTIPDAAYAWGTRLDAAKYYMNDLLPQLENNEAGIITIEGVGYNLWDVTRDLTPTGAFHHMLDKFVKPGAAPGAGADYTSGIQAALDEFDLVSQSEKAIGDNAEKVKFIVFFSDGGFTGDAAALDKELDLLKKNNVRLLIVAMGGSNAVNVPKYDETTHRRNGEFYAGTTALDDGILKHMRDAVPGSELIYAPPGTAHIHYSFPQKAGGLYAKATQSNLRPWLLALALLLFASITVGGGGLPRWRLINPVQHLADIWRAVRRFRFLSTRPQAQSIEKDNDHV
jgi:hypothetical protein